MNKPASSKKDKSQLGASLTESAILAASLMFLCITAINSGSHNLRDTYITINAQLGGGSDTTTQNISGGCNGCEIPGPAGGTPEPGQTPKPKP